MRYKQRIIACGNAAAVLIMALSAQATDYTSNFNPGDVASANLNDPAKWTPNTGYPGKGVGDKVDITNITLGGGNRALLINVDAIHLAEFKFNAASTATLQVYAANAARTITIDSIIKNSSSTLQFYNGSDGVNTLSMDVGNVAVNAGTMELGASSRSLQFTVSGTTTISTGAEVRVSSGAKVKLGHLNLSAATAAVRTSAYKNGIVEVSSLTGNGIVETTNLGGSVTRGDLILNNSNASEVTFSGVLRNGNAGSLHVTKQGAGTQILSGNTNTYSGTTSITAGTLLVTNTAGSGTGSGSVTVDASGTLGGNGIIAPGAGNNVTVIGALSPGSNNAAALTFKLSGASKLDFASGSKLQFSLGTTSDSIAFTTAGDWLSGSGNVTLELTLGDGFAYGVTYNIFTNTTTSGFNVASVTGYDTANYIHVFTQIGNNYVISFQAIPEAGTVGLLSTGSLLFMAGALARRKE